MLCQLSYGGPWRAAEDYQSLGECSDAAASQTTSRFTGLCQADPMPVSGWLSIVECAGRTGPARGEGESMRKRLTAVALAGTVGLGAVGATVVAYPALADNSTKESPQPGSEAAKQAAQDRRTAAIRKALQGLVDDKTLTADQADKVAGTLAKSEAVRGGPGDPVGPGGPGVRRGGGLLGVEGPKADEAAAKVLGLSVDDLRTQLRSGSTLAEIAKKQGKDVDTLVTALVAVAKEQLDESVKAGRLTQETATQIEKTLEQRVRTVVQNGRPAPGAMGGKAWRGGPEGVGPGGRGWPGGPEGTAPDGQAPNGERVTPDPGPSASPSAATSSYQTT
jgi:hypothetical protein